MNRFIQLYPIFRKAGHITKSSLICAALCIQAAASEAGLTVRVFDKSTDDPVAGVFVKVAAGPVHSTNATGRLQFSDIAPGVYELFLSCPGYKSAIIPAIVISPNQECSVIVNIEKGFSPNPQIISPSTDQVVELEEVVVSLLTLDL